MDCEKDADCKGFRYSHKYSKCYLYTTANCTFGCEKSSKNNVGKILHYKQENLGSSGCLIKNEGNE